MPEPALPRLDPERRERLAALGLELLSLRAELATPVAVPLAAGTRAGGRLALAGVPWPATDALLRGIVAALGLRADEVAPPPLPGRPVLQFGEAGDRSDAPDAVALPALAALREARAKRAAWPRLRALRARLRQDAPG
jgi:hypothetical protein